MEQQGKELDVMESLNIIWKKKWLIIIPTFVLVLGIGMVCLRLPRVWEVDAIFLPSKLTIQTEQGALEEIVLSDPKQIVGEIMQESYNALIASDLKLDIRTFPKLRAENLRDTDLVRIWIDHKDSKTSAAIINSLYKILKAELDKKTEVEIKGIDLQIAKTQNEIKDKETQIESTQNKLKISAERLTNLQAEMKSVKERIDDLEQQVKRVIAEKRESGEAVSLLLYSNEVQRNLQYYNTLDEKMSSEKIWQENARNEMKTMKNNISTLQASLQHWSDRKLRIDYARLVKDPTVSLKPVSPRPMQAMTLAALAGFFLMSLLVIFIERFKRATHGS